MDFILVNLTIITPKKNNLPQTNYYQYYFVPSMCPDIFYDLQIELNYSTEHYILIHFILNFILLSKIIVYYYKIVHWSTFEVYTKQI